MIIYHIYIYIYQYGYIWEKIYYIKLYNIYMYDYIIVCTGTVCDFSHHFHRPSLHRSELAGHDLSRPYLQVT